MSTTTARRPLAAFCFVVGVVALVYTAVLLVRGPARSAVGPGLSTASCLLSGAAVRLSARTSTSD